MKRIFFLAVIFLAINLFAQKADSTNYKKYESILKQIDSQFQELQKTKLLADGQYFQSFQKLQSQAQTINELLKQEGKNLVDTYGGANDGWTQDKLQYLIDNKKRKEVNLILSDDKLTEQEKQAELIKLYNQTKQK